MSLPPRTSFASRCVARLAAFFAVFFATFVAAPSGAVTLAVEDFGYALGELDGRAGGTGFSGAWTANTGATEVADPGTSLSYDNGTLSLDGGDRALRITGNSNALGFRSLATSISADSVYVSFLLRFDGSIEDNDFVVLWHDNTSTGSHTSRPNIGVKGNEGDGSGPADVVARLQLSGGGQAYAAPLVPGTTYFILGRLHKSTPGATNDYDRFDVWVNPNANSMGAPDLTAAGAGSIDAFSLVGLRSANVDPGDAVWIDELTYSTTFATAVPQPTSALLVGLGLLGLGVAGDRRAAAG